MKGTARPVRLTYQDYLLFPDDGKRYEIIEGEKIMTPAPVPRHQKVLGSLVRLLLKFLSGKDLGEWYIAPIDVVLSRHSVVQPDLLFITRDRLSIVGEKAITGAPDLVMEVVSEATRRTDHVRKRKLYAAHGVREHWIVDPEVERVEVFVLQGKALQKRGEHEEGEAHSPCVLPGFRAPVREVFA
jgi:Uma2 family endonuclease